jgi:hypothetical protein
MIRSLAVMALGGLLAAAVIDTAGPEDELGKGVQQVKDGNFEAGLLSLDGVVTSLAASSDPKDVHDRAQAHLYLGVAYVGLLQETPARKHFREALKLDPELKVDPQQFPARVVRVFDAARTNKKKPALYAGASLVGLAAAGGAAAALIGGSAAIGITTAVVVSSDTTTTTTTTLPLAPPLRTGAFNIHPFTQAVTGNVIATVVGPADGDLGLSLCRGVATSTRECNFAAAGGGPGTQSVSASLSAGTNTLVVQAVRIPPGAASISYTFRIQTP